MKSESYIEKNDYVYLQGFKKKTIENYYQDKNKDTTFTVCINVFECYSNKKENVTYKKIELN